MTGCIPMRPLRAWVLVLLLPLTACATRTITIDTPAGEVFRDCAHCPEMVVVPAGSFTMGSPADEEGRHRNEGPQHEVTFDKPFAVGRYPVTVGEFSRFVKETGYEVAGNYSLGCQNGWLSPSRYGSDQTARHPVSCITHEAASSYATWLAETTGHHYRLLTEAEWEYSARAGTTGPYPFPLEALNEHANVLTKGSPHDYTSPVGSYRPNAFGLYDMHGNVWEWVQDCWRPNYEKLPTAGASEAASCEPQITRGGSNSWLVSSSGKADLYVMRGGSWYVNPPMARSATRQLNSPDFQDDDFGFRVARDL